MRTDALQGRAGWALIAMVALVAGCNVTKSDSDEDDYSGGGESSGEVGAVVVADPCDDVVCPDSLPLTTTTPNDEGFTFATGAHGVQAADKVYWTGMLDLSCCGISKFVITGKGTAPDTYGIEWVSEDGIISGGMWGTTAGVLDRAGSAEWRMTLMTSPGRRVTGIVLQLNSCDTEECLAAFGTVSMALEY